MPFSHIIFTGGSVTGGFVMKDAASKLTKVTLELGGQNHTVIDSSADLDWVAKSIVTFKFLNCGQTCIATNHIFVPKNISNELI